MIEVHLELGVLVHSEVKGEVKCRDKRGFEGKCKNQLNPQQMLNNVDPKINLNQNLRIK